MAINLGPLVKSAASSLQGAAGSAAAQFTEQEVRNIAAQVATSAAQSFAFRQPQVSQQQPLPKPTFVGGLADLASAPASLPMAAASFPTRLASREAMSAIRMGTGLAANVAGGTEGDVLSATVGEATAGFQSFLNFVTMPNVSNFGKFMEHVSTAPGKIEQFGEALLQARKELIKYSPEYAQAEAERTIAGIQRQIESAERTGPDALKLSRGLEELKDAIQPIQDEIFNITSQLILRVIPTLIEILEEIKPLIPELQKLAEVAIDLFKIMLQAVPWDILKFAVGVVADIPGFWPNYFERLINVNSAVDILESILILWQPAISWILDWFEEEEEDQGDLKDMNEMKSTAAQNIIRDLLFKGSN